MICSSASKHKETSWSSCDVTDPTVGLPVVMAFHCLLHCYISAHCHGILLSAEEPPITFTLQNSTLKESHSSKQKKLI